MEYSGFPTHSRCIGIASDHGGFELKEKLRQAFKDEGYDLVDFGARQYEKDDDYPDVVVPLARAIMRGEVDRGIAICGSGVGVCISANKFPGVRVALITDKYSAKQGVEDEVPLYRRVFLLQTSNALIYFVLLFYSTFFLSNCRLFFADRPRNANGTARSSNVLSTLWSDFLL